MKQIAIGQLLQETNTLNPVPTTKADFDVYGWDTGSQVVDKYGDMGELSGLTQLPEALREPIEWVGLLRAVAWSGGPLESGLLRKITLQMPSALSPQIDGVLLSLHGAQSAIEDEDVSGHALEAVRQAVGPQVPVVATLDLHANVTPRMATNADVLVGYHTFSHVDGYHTFSHVDHVSCGRRAADCLARLLQGERAAVSLYKTPMVPNNEGRTTDRGVFAGFIRDVVECESRPDVLSLGFYNVQPWFDVPLLGWSLYQAWLPEGSPPSEPLATEVVIEGLGDLQYRLSGHSGHNLPVDMGRFARVRVQDTTLVLVEKTGHGGLPQLYEAAGADPRHYKVVLANSPKGFSADYEPFASAVLYAAAQGCATPEIDRIDFQNTTRPLWPQDDMVMEDAVWADEIFARRHEEIAA